MDTQKTRLAFGALLARGGWYETNDGALWETALLREGDLGESTQHRMWGILRGNVLWEGIVSLHAGDRAILTTLGGNADHVEAMLASL